MKRPYMNSTGEQVRQLARTHWDSFVDLGLVAYEMQFRDLISEERKAEIVERLIRLGLEEQSENSSPGFEFPATDVYEIRSASTRGLDGVAWREKGLLWRSGYHVGRSNGEPEHKRRRILNFIFLEDDLHDVDDPGYAAEWGNPKSSRRLEKLTNTIASLARNAKRTPHDTAQAVSDWESDLEYLKSTFYDRWGDFPWPDVEV